MDGVHVGDGAGGGGGSSNGESVGNLFGIFIMDMDFFVVGAGVYVVNASFG